MSPSSPSDARRVSTLLGLLFGLAGMGSSSAAIALPVLASDPGITTAVSAWAISLYALMLAVATAVYGRVSDLVGIRLPLLVGVGPMTAGALAGAAAPSFGVLAARIFQGAGAVWCAVPRSAGSPASRLRSAAWDRSPVEASRRCSGGGP